MMQFYVCKRAGLFGLQVGHVERVATRIAVPLVLDGTLEEFDARNKAHRGAPGANAAIERLAALEDNPAKASELRAWLEVERARQVSRVSTREAEHVAERQAAQERARQPRAKTAAA